MSRSEMPNLSDLLATPPVSETTFGRDSKKWTFQQEFDPTDPNTRTVTAIAGDLKTEKDWREVCEQNGAWPVPEGYRVRLVEMRHYTAAWTREDQGQDAITKPSWWYKFAVEPVLEKVSSNIDDLIQAVNKRKKPAPRNFGGDYAYQWSAGDLQIGKGNETDAAGEGPEGTLLHLVRSLEAGVEELKKLRKIRPIGTVALNWVGDCIEGNQSQGGNNMWLTPLTITEQTRLFRRVLMYGIELFAPLADELQVNVVNGNHDRVQDFQKTRSDDGHATEAAIAIAEALELNPSAYGHVKVYIPNKGWGYMTHAVGDTIVTFAHGHQWTKDKAFQWWGEQALNLQNPTAAHILLHGHFHEYKIQAKRERTVVCTPTFEERSQYWVERHGDLSKRGAVSMLTLTGEIEFAHII